MSRQVINIGNSPNDRKGDPARTAFEKINENFTEVYANQGLVQYARVTLTSAQVEGCGTSPVVIVASPGPNKFILPIAQHARWVPGTPYANVSLILTVGRQLAFTYGAMVSSNAETWQSGMGALQNFATPFPPNQPLTITQISGINLSGGSNGSLTLYVAYIVVDL
jgi:hypothetical protein